MKIWNSLVIAVTLALAGCGGEPSSPDSGTEQANANSENAVAAGAAVEGGMKLCTHRLMELDKQLADSKLTNEQKASFALTRESAVAMCAKGQEKLAVEMTDSLSAAIEKASGISASVSEDDANANQKTAPGEEYALGDPRSDLERFYGLYALPGQSDRQLFVAPAKSPNPDRPIPDGYIMINAMWGDATNWYMKSVADTRFEQQWVNPAGSPMIATFEIDESSNASSLSVTSEYLNYNNMPRVGDLPEDWQ